jgi:PAS domain-containing protein
MKPRRNAETPVTLSAEPDLLRALLDATTDLIYVKDREGRYVSINDAGARTHNPGRSFAGHSALISVQY